MLRYSGSVRRLREVLRGTPKNCTPRAFQYRLRMAQVDSLLDELLHQRAPGSKESGSD